MSERPLTQDCPTRRAQLELEGSVKLESTPGQHAGAQHQDHVAGLWDQGTGGGLQLSFVGRAKQPCKAPGQHAPRFARRAIHPIDFEGDKVAIGCSGDDAGSQAQKQLSLMEAEVDRDYDRGLVRILIQHQTEPPDTFAFGDHSQQTDTLRTGENLGPSTVDPHGVTVARSSMGRQGLWTPLRPIGSERAHLTPDGRGPSEAGVARVGAMVLWPCEFRSKARTMVGADTGRLAPT